MADRSGALAPRPPGGGGAPTGPSPTRELDAQAGIWRAAGWRRWAWARAAAWPPRWHPAARLAAWCTPPRGSAPPLVPLNTRLPRTEQRRQATAARADVIVVDAAGRVRVAQVDPRAELDPAAVHAVLFTSGTTGEPKPVELDARQTRTPAAQASAAALGSDPDDRWLCPLPLFHIAGLAILVRCARAATTAVLHAGLRRGRRATALTDGGITLVSLVPTQLAASARRRAGVARRACARCCWAAGPIPPDLLDVGGPARAAGALHVRHDRDGSQVVVTERGRDRRSAAAGRARSRSAPAARSWCAARWSRRSALAADGLAAHRRRRPLRPPRPAARGGPDQGADRHRRREGGAGGGGGGAAAAPVRGRRGGGRAARTRSGARR